MSDESTPVPPEIHVALAAVGPPDPAWVALAAEKQGRLTMPTGSLGRLLEIGRQLAGLQRTAAPDGEPSVVLIFAADHGVAEAGVSAYPQAVTGQMVANFVRGGAAVNILARRAGSRVVVVNMGVKHPPFLPRGGPGVVFWPIRRGTSNFLEGPAMTRDEAFRAFLQGRNLAFAETKQGEEAPGVRVVALGEMGIGNSTSAAALIAAMTGASPETVVGRGTGVDEAGLRRKIDAVDLALRLHGPDCRDRWDWLARIGGFEILAMAGAAVGAAQNGALVVLDGLISTAAGLIAARLCPSIVGSMIAAHLGTEPGHRIALEALGLKPLLDLELRLGEGSGAVLALPLIASAADILRDMATFESAGVADRLPGIA